MKKKVVFGIFLAVLLGVGILLPTSKSGAFPIAELQAILHTNLPLLVRNTPFHGSDQTGPGIGSITGLVFNASLQNKPPIPGAVVCIKNTPNCVVTGDDGRYRFDGLGVKAYRLTVSNEDFYTLEAEVQVVNNRPSVYDFGMVSLLVSGNIEMRITVEWVNSEHWPGSDCLPDYPVGCPTDLDAHIWAHYTGGDFHHYQDNPGNCNTAAAICLELYSYNGPGPETAAIRKITDPNTLYYYGVQNFYQDRTGVPSIRLTGALVRIYRLDGTLLEYTANAVPDGNGDFWYLFSMNAQGQITIHNCITTIPQDPDPNDNIIPVPQCPAQ